MALDSEPTDPTTGGRPGVAGALSSFVGITRGTFVVDGIAKRVMRLEYEAYEPMAIRELEKIVASSVERWSSLTAVVIAHRIGVVPVGEASVVVVTSSPHRRESIEAVAWLMDTLKRTVPIWKKEIYEDGSAWKKNSECGCG
ncbi:Molybdopterin biosynthesis MoaE [Zopfochytrium polystomum]|nr:Molybdopterin biosynthesis MoaE [Zopfochytrium polystomum]